MAEKLETVTDLGGGVVISDEVSKLAGLLSGGAEDDTDKNSAEPDPGSDDDAPAEKPASGEDKEGQERDDTPAIKAPASWDEDAAEKFKTLPSDMQKLITEREAERERGVNSKLQEAAKEREALTAKQSEIGQLRSAYEQRLVAFAGQLNASIPEEFKAIKSPADLYAVSQKDPALAARFTAFQSQAAGVMNELAQIQQQRSAEAQASHREFLTKEAEAISKVWPEFVDEKKGPAIRSELSAYAKDRGFSDAEVNGLADHRLVMVLRDASEGRKAMKALEKAKSKADKPNLPKVAKPGQGERGQSNGLDTASLKSALRSGSTDRQVAAMQRILEGR
jgi:hypothetical protein